MSKFNHEYEEALDWMFQQLPMYQRDGAPALKKNLFRTIELSNFLGNPHHSFKSIHVAGTNGKGSVSHMLASVLMEAGFKVGLYTSPHLVDFRERIQVNGKMIPKSKVLDFLKHGKEKMEELSPSFFEMTVCMAFDYFAKEEVDWAIIETGLGGRLDSTNILRPDLSVITNISLDHIGMLGDTLKRIAIEKAGIIKPSVPLVLGRMQEDIFHVFEEKCKNLNSPLIIASETSFSLDSDLRGDFQKENARTAVSAIRVLSNAIQVDDEKVKSGLLNVGKNTGLRGRFEILSKNPFIICDIAHNEDAIANLFGELKNYQFDNLHVVFGTVNDKEHESILKSLPKEADYYLCKPNIPRGLAAENLQRKFISNDLESNIFNSVKQAFEAAKTKVKKDDLILVTGSAFVVAEVLDTPN